MGVILSVKDDKVWASWIDDRAPVMLGEHRAVLRAMSDLIQQSAIGERLVNRSAPSEGART